MKLAKTLLAGLLVLVAASAFGVSPEVKVDLTMTKITVLLKDKNLEDALPYFAELEAMEPTLSKPLSEGFQMLYIDTLYKAGRNEKALERANLYLEKFGDKGKYYEKVIEIASRLQIQADREAKEHALKEEKERQEKIAALVKERDRLLREMQAESEYKEAFGRWAEHMEKCGADLEEYANMRGRQYGENPNEDSYNEAVRTRDRADEMTSVDGYNFNAWCVRKYPPPEKP